MFEYATSRATRTVLALATAATVGMTGLAGAAQAGDEYDDDDKYKSDKVTVKICKRVKDRHEKEYGKYHAKKKFKIYAETDEDGPEEFKLGHKQCAKAVLEYDKNKVVVWEKQQKGYDVKYKVIEGGKDEGRVNRHGEFVVKFDKYQKFIEIRVINKEKKDHEDKEYTSVV